MIRHRNATGRTAVRWATVTAVAAAAALGSAGAASAATFWVPGGSSDLTALCREGGGTIKRGVNSRGEPVITCLFPSGRIILCDASEKDCKDYPAPRKLTTSIRPISQGPTTASR